MNKLQNPTPSLAAAATSSNGDGKKPSRPLSTFLYYSSSTIGLLFIAIAILWGLEAPVWFGFAFLIIAVLLEPRAESRHPVAEVVRLKAQSAELEHTAVTPIIEDQESTTLMGVTRVFRSGELLEETNWKAIALEREELLEHYGLIGIAARGTL